MGFSGSAFINHELERARAEKWAGKALEGECDAVARETTGRRNERLNLAAFNLGQLVGGGHLDDAKVLDRLFAAAEACGLVAEDGRDAALATINSGLTAGMEHPRHPKERPHPRPEPAAAAGETREVESRPRGLDFRKGALWLSRDVEPVLDDAWLIRDWIPRRGLSVIFGASGAGKSHLVADMACHVARNETWHGNPVEPGFVIYVALEGHGSLPNRVAALARTFGDAPVWFIRAPFSLAEMAGHVDELVETIRAEAAAKGLTVRWVIVDTLARAMAGMEENSAKDMGAAVAGLEAITGALDCAVSVIHHSGKDQARGERGSGSLRAATEASIEVTADGNGAEKVITATAGKVRDGEDGGTFTYRLAQVELGIDKWGRAVTSCTVEALGEEETAERRAKAKVKRLSPEAFRFLEALRQYADDNGTPNPGGTGWPRAGSRRVVLHDAFVAWAKDKSGAARDADKRAAARKQVKALLDAGLIQMNEGFLWEVRPSEEVSECE